MELLQITVQASLEIWKDSVRKEEMGQKQMVVGNALPVSHLVKAYPHTILAPWVEVHGVEEQTL